MERKVTTVGMRVPASPLAVLSFGYGGDHSAVCSDLFAQPPALRFPPLIPRYGPLEERMETQKRGPR